jgi:sugar phosphate isomerase/epimerase
MGEGISRREMLTRTGVCLGAAAAGVRASTAAQTRAAGESEPFGYCLNTATIMGQKLSVVEEVEIAAKAGYQGIEPWTRNIQQYLDGGGSLEDLGKRIADSGLKVVGAIGFPRWAVNDEQERAQGVEQLRVEMDMVARIGGGHIAAPPAGINRSEDVSLSDVGRRYRAVLELGRQMGVVPQLEIWGSALTLGRVSEAVHVAAEADHPGACLLLDAFHMYRGGSGFECLRLLNGAAMHDFHLNDYPAEPPREEIKDSDRVYPGDGVCPLDLVLGTLRQTGFRGMLSLEVFNRAYWEQDPLLVAQTGLEKMRAAVAKALG